MSECNRTAQHNEPFKTISIAEMVLTTLSRHQLRPGSMHAPYCTVAAACWSDWGRGGGGFPVYSAAGIVLSNTHTRHDTNPESWPNSEMAHIPAECTPTGRAWIQTIPLVVAACVCFCCNNLSDKRPILACSIDFQKMSCKWNMLAYYARAKRDLRL